MELYSPTATPELLKEVAQLPPIENYGDCVVLVVISVPQSSAVWDRCELGLRQFGTSIPRPPQRRDAQQHVLYVQHMQHTLHHGETPDHWETSQSQSFTAQSDRKAPPSNLSLSCENLVTRSIMLPTSYNDPD